MKKRSPSVPSGDNVSRMNLTLSRALDNAIDDVGREARAHGGARLAKTEIIRAACRMLLKMDVDLQGVENEDDLLERLLTRARFSSREVVV